MSSHSGVAVHHSGYNDVMISKTSLRIQELERELAAIKGVLGFLSDILPDEKIPDLPAG